MTHPDELAIYLPDGAVAPPTNPYGRLVANAGVYRALARYGGYRRLHFQCRRPAAAEQLARELLVPAPVKAPAITTGSPLSTSAPSRAGTLLSGQPYLSQPAWVRRHAGRDAAYSIVGTVFAFSSAPHRELMLHSLLAPLHEWDALICSSPTLRDTVVRTLDDMGGPPARAARGAAGGPGRGRPAAPAAAPAPRDPLRRRRRRDRRASGGRSRAPGAS